MVEKLTTQDLLGIVGALDIANGEVGGGYEPLIEKIKTSYPQVGKTIAKREKNDQDESDKQSKARKKYALDVFNKLVDSGEGKLLQVLEKEIVKNYDDARHHYSDDICLAADLWKYHLPELVELGLLDEIREEMRSDKFESKYADSEPEKELWHRLARILGRAHIDSL